MSDASGFRPGGLGCGDGPHLHTPREAAVLLRVGESTLRKRVAKRVIPCTLVGGLIRFSDEDLRQLIADGSRQPTTRTPPSRAPRTRRR